jgi:phosphinothricin acetyltransferase
MVQVNTFRISQNTDYIRGMITIRPAQPADVPFITEIYNEAIVNTTATFDTELKTETDRMIWLEAHDEMHPVLVAELNGRVIGWASLSRWSERAAYDTTAEVSLYVHKDFRNQGIGKKLLEVLTLEGEKAGLHTLLARITEGNDKSVYLHEVFGFENVGTLKEVGKKFGKFLDVRILQKVY